MLPVVLIGENVQQLHHISRSMPMAQCVPLRNIKFNQREDIHLIPALGAPSIVMLDVDAASQGQVGHYIKRFKMTYPDSAVLVLTSFGDTQAEQAAIDCGADDVLLKPVSVCRLSLTLRNLSELVSRRMSVGSAAMDYVGELHRPDLVCLLNGDGTLKRLHFIEQDIIQFAVDYCQGHISNTAKALGIGRSTLYRKLDSIETRMRFQQRVSPKPPVAAMSGY